MWAPNHGGPATVKRHARSVSGDQHDADVVRSRGAPEERVDDLRGLASLLALEPELHFGDDVLVPDWAGWRRERMPAFQSTPFFTLAPDWVCEIVSPSTGRIDRTRKMRIYARERVAHLWFVDPLARTLEIYRLEEGRWIVVRADGGDDVVRAEPFDAVELRLGRWWVTEPTPGPASR